MNVLVDIMKIQRNIWKFEEKTHLKKIYFLKQIMLKSEVEIN